MKNKGEIQDRHEAQLEITSRNNQTIDMNPKPLIGVLIGGLRSEYEHHVCAGIRDAASEYGVTVVYYAMTPVGVDTPLQNEYHQIGDYVVYEIIDPNLLDGLIVMAEVVDSYCSLPEVANFYQRYRAVPMVNIGSIHPMDPAANEPASMTDLPSNDLPSNDLPSKQAANGSPNISIEIDNYQGMRELLTYLISECNHRQLAFITGNPAQQSADARYRAYIDVLQQHNIPYDPDFVFEGDSRKMSGIYAVEELIEGRQLSPDVIIAANDEMALGVIEALQSRGIHVPQDIAVAGFDNIDACLWLRPSLTTVEQPMYLMGYTAVERLLDILAEGTLDRRLEKAESLTPNDDRHSLQFSRTILETKLIQRESCGYYLIQKGLNDDATDAPFPFSVSAKEFHKLYEKNIYLTYRSWLKMNRSYTDQSIFDNVVRGFVYDLENPNSTEFMTSLRHLIHSIPTFVSNISFWQKIIDGTLELTRTYLGKSAAGNRSMNLCFDAYRLLSNEALRHQKQKQWMTTAIEQNGRELLYNSTLETLGPVLASTLQRLGIDYCYISLFDTYPEPDKNVRLVVSYEQTVCQIMADGGPVYPAAQLLPPGKLAQPHPQQWMYMLLHYQDTFIGQALVSMGPCEGVAYESLRVQIASMLKLTLMHREQREYAQRLEETVTQRTQALEAMIAENNELMGMVVHDLRNPLSAIDLSVNSLLRRWQKLSPEQVERSLHRVTQSTHTMVGLIEHLLEENRRKYTDNTNNTNNTDNTDSAAVSPSTEPDTGRRIFIAPLLHTSVEQLQPQAEEKGIQLTLAYPPEFEQITTGIATGSQLDMSNALTQVFDNIISNAVKYTYPNTTININVEHLPEQIHISVIDQGQGLSTQDMKNLFQKYHRLTAQPTGGESSKGLGLYIAKKLIRGIGGDIVAESAGRDQGATFTIQLPMVRGGEREKGRGGDTAT